MNQFDIYDVEELAYRAMGKTEKEAEELMENGDIDEFVYGEYGCDFETYCLIVRDLLPFTPVVTAALTGSKFHAFVDAEQQRAIVKLAVK